LNIYIGADHRGFFLKKKLVKYLTGKGYSVIDVGSFKAGAPCDYPKFSEKVAKSVLADKGSRGILACMTGIGHSMAANKFRGIRAALCYNRKAAELSRSHNDANVLIVGSKFVSQKDIFGIVDAWLKTEFEGGRHLRRVNQIKNIEKHCC